MDIKLVSTLLFLHFIALVSPGPDLVLTLRNAIHQGTKAGISSALGFASGIFFHSLIAVFILKGFSWLPVAALPWLALPGALYLIYLGIKNWPTQAAPSSINLAPVSARSPYRQGLITNLLNPKASLFTIGLITGKAPAHSTALTLIVLILSMMMLTFIWFSLVSMVLTPPKIRAYYFSQSRRLDYLFSILLILFGCLLLKDLLGLFLDNLS